MKTLLLEIITPEKIVYSREIDEVLIPTTTGEIGILPGHIPLFTVINPGELKIKKDNHWDYLAVTAGFADVNAEKVTILADYAVRSEEIDEAKVQKAKSQAEKAMLQKETDRDFALAEAELRKTILELKVARRRKTQKM